MIRVENNKFSQNSTGGINVNSMSNISNPDDASFSLPEQVKSEKKKIAKLSVQITMISGITVDLPILAVQITGNKNYLDEIDKTLILFCLNQANNNQSEAARMIGISRYALRYRMSKHGIR